MSIFAELIEAVVYAVVDLTAMLAALASKPLRFLASSRYRHEVRQTWRQRPVKHLFELLSGSIVVVLLLSLIVFLGTAVVSLMRRILPPPKLSSGRRRVSSTGGSYERGRNSVTHGSSAPNRPFERAGTHTRRPSDCASTGRSTPLR